ncbi:MAG: DUF58 domain-containing protein [Cytophagales bacterium]|nr:MAG: DUF58 domain-containing protein [Cytophagales bacterium]
MKKNLHLQNLAEIREFGNIEFLAKQMVEGFITGLHRSPFHGFSVEFAEHRLYNTGESTRHVDWKVYARTDKLFTKRYEEETNLRAHLLIDISPSMYYPQPEWAKINFSILAAASLAYMLQKQKDAVGLATFAEKIYEQFPAKSTSTHLNKIFIALQNQLQAPPTVEQSNIAETIHQIAEKINRRSLVIIFSDMLDNVAHADQLFAALQHLKHNKHEVLLFHVMDKKTELDFEFEDRPYEFIDLETKEKVKLQPSQVKAYFQEQAKNFHQALKLRCGQYKIDWIEADVRQGFEQILYAYLIKRSKIS